MNGIFGKDWSGDPFVLFGTAHLTALGIIVLINILAVIWGRKASDANRRDSGGFWPAF